MIKGTRVTAQNSTQAVGTGIACYNMLAIPTGKTFVLTDLAVVGSAYTNTVVATAGSAMQLILFDQAGTGIASGVTAGLVIHLDTIGTAAAWNSVGKVMQWTDGPEFTVGVSPQLAVPGAGIIATYGLFIGGMLK